MPKRPRTRRRFLRTAGSVRDRLLLGGLLRGVAAGRGRLPRAGQAPPARRLARRAVARYHPSGRVTADHGSARRPRGHEGVRRHRVGQRRRLRQRRRTHRSEGDLRGPAGLQSDAGPDRARSGSRGLLKNDPGQVDALEPAFDGCLAEEAYEQRQVDDYMPFREAGKWVGICEYTGRLRCEDARERGVHLIKKSLDLGAPVLATCG